MHIEFGELVNEKIPALRGRDGRNNKFVLETLALHGPLIKYDVFKALKTRVKYYPTISRRIDDLAARGYLAVAGKRLIKVGKRTEESPTYSLTWRGLIASLTIDVVIERTTEALRINPLLELPFSKEMIINVIDELLTPKERIIVVHSLVEGFFRALPRDLESIEQEKYIAYAVPMVVEIPELAGTFGQKDFTRLLTIPGFSEFITRLVNSFEEQLKTSLVAVQVIKKDLNNYLQTIQNDVKKNEISLAPH